MGVEWSSVLWIFCLEKCCLKNVPYTEVPKNVNNMNDYQY